MATDPQKDLIDLIRGERFGIGSHSSDKKFNRTLARMLNQAIMHLSSELYQTDMNFIYELLQNAEENDYENAAFPTVELVLTESDIAGVGADATLVVFNNEIGFQPQEVEALCDVCLSTKKGDPDSSYTCKKGMGFKSVFLVTRTPYVISNGYRFRFADEASTSEAKLGYVVPEWVDRPTDADLRQVYGKQHLREPKTVIILPLRPDKVELVREQLRRVSPETLLFLSKIRQLVVRDEVSKTSFCITRTESLPAAMGVPGDDQWALKTARFALEGKISYVSEDQKKKKRKKNQFTYHVLKQQFPVTNGVEQRKNVYFWDISLAFPVRDRGNTTGDIFSLERPTYLTCGFPFLVNADFLLEASHQTLKFDSPWNIGILSYVPTVFLSAFRVFLQKSDTVRESYRYIPLEAQNAEFQKVQEDIVDGLKRLDSVLVDSSVGYIRCDNFCCTPNIGRLVRPEFHKILWKAKRDGNLNPVLENPRSYIVDRKVQDRYTNAMNYLGVSEMTDDEYMEFLGQGEWLLNLREDLYWDIIWFVYKRQMFTIPVLKYFKQDGSIGLASIEEAGSANRVKIYLSPMQRGEWLSDWASVFNPWVSVEFMPATTLLELRDRKAKSDTKICEIWDCLFLAVTEMSVKSYVRQLLGLMGSATDPQFIILATEFVYQCIQGKDVELSEVCIDFPNTFPIVDEFSRITWFDRNKYNFNDCIPILLPAHASSWPKLSLNSWSNQLVVMSNDYLKPLTTWNGTMPSSKLSISNREDPLELESFRNYLKSIISANDIPNFVPPPDAVYEWPEHLSLSLTIDLVKVLLQWLAICLKVSSIPRSPFLILLTETKWIPTEVHGWRRPSSCFESLSLFSGSSEPSDVPCVHQSLIDYRSTLADLGVITEFHSGCDAVANYMFEMSKDTNAQDSCNLEKAIRLYTYLKRFGWTSPSNGEKLTIFVPGTANTANTWKESSSCVIRRDIIDVSAYNCADVIFGSSLTVLEDIYPWLLLPFFCEVLGVPERAPVEKFCDLWLLWTTQLYQPTLEECSLVWKPLSEKWADCDVQFRQNFVAKAMVPFVCEVSGDFHRLPSPSAIFIADDLDLRSLFKNNPQVKFAWYPDQSEKMETALNKVYTAMGVKKFSECVQVEFNVRGNSGGDDFVQNEEAQAGNRILCGGLFRAILGFMAIKKYGLSSSERQDVLTPLTRVEETWITGPIIRSYKIPCLTPPVEPAQETVFAFWSIPEAKLYLVNSEDPSFEIRNYHIHLARTLSTGLLRNHPGSIADDLNEFLLGLVPSKFEASHVERELTRRNAKLYPEDDIFLSDLGR